MIPPRDIPGYAEAVSQESNLRELSFLPDMPEFICGVEIVPLTLRKLQILRAVSSPFIIGGRLPMVEDVAIFLWILSPKYNLSRWRRYWFVRGIRKINYAAALKAIDTYVSESFTDSPPSRDGNTKSYWSMTASMIDSFAHEYQWGLEQIQNAPLKSLFQLTTIIRKRNDPSSCLFNPSDKVAREYRRKMREQNGK